MVLRHYPALITQDEGDPPEAAYGVVFPDFPGCVSVGATVQEAEAMAAEVLALHVEGMLEDGEPLPEPSPPGEVPQWLAEVPGEIAAHVMVPIEVPPSGATESTRERFMRIVRRKLVEHGYSGGQLEARLNEITSKEDLSFEIDWEKVVHH